VTGLRGDPDHPTTRGRVCPKARFQLERHHSASRLRHPLVRQGSVFLRATWPEALGLVAGKLLAARENHGSLSVIHFSDTGSKGYLKDLYQRLFNLFGGVTVPRGSLCWSAGLAAQRVDFGRVLAHAPGDLEKARAVVIWGRNPADTSRHLMPFVRAAMSQGAPVVVVDPLRTATVKDLGARHVAPRPGTDAVLALAVGAELVRRGAYDQAFCRERSRGFETFARKVAGVGGAAGLTVQAAARFCDIPEEDVRFLVGLLEARRPAAFLLGYGLQRHARGGEAVRAIDALAALAGSIGRSGGGANYANFHPEGLLRNVASEGLAEGEPPARRVFDRPRFGRQAPELADPSPQVLFVNRSNPVAQLPGTDLVVQAFRSIPFKVVADLVMTDTAALADVVLPVADFLEDEDLFRCSWHAYLTWAAPAVAPPEEVWSETRIVAELAGRLGLGQEFARSPSEWIVWALEPLVAAYPGLAARPEDLRGRSFANPAVLDVPWADGPFATPSGRFEFGKRWASLVALGEAEALAGAEAPAAGDLAAPGDGLFHLISPRHRLSMHSQFYDRVLAQTSGGSGLPAVFAHPRAAARLGLAEGDEVRLTSAQGSLLAHLVLDDGLREDTLCLYAGGSAGFIAGARPASANALTPDNLTDIGLQAAYYDCRCALQAARPTPA